MRISLPDPEQFRMVFEEEVGQRLADGILGIATDSREVLPGDLFIALPGERVDGHQFLSQVADQGAVAVLVSRPTKNIKAQTIQVENPVQTIGRIANRWRRRFSIPVIGITGTNGKTSTKDLLRHLLAEKFSVHATTGNYNTSIGLPLSLLTLTGDHTVSILEMGASQAGDIAYLCRLAEPTIGLITNIAPAHLEGFGSIDDIAREKGELFRALADGTAFINASDERVRSLPAAGKSIFYGFTPDCEYAADLYTNPDNTLTLTINTHEIATQSSNPLLARNMLAATAVCRSLGLDWDVITSRIASYAPPPGRCELKQIRGMTIIDDTYNANLVSTLAALDYLSAFSRGRRIFVFGDMLELGDEARDFHTRVGSYCNEKPVDAVYTIGELTRFTHASLNSQMTKFHADNKAELLAELTPVIKPGDTILFKGSRGMKMETLIRDLTES